MNKLMKTASSLTLAAVLAASPLAVVAQTTTDSDQAETMPEAEAPETGLTTEMPEADAAPEANTTTEMAPADDTMAPADGTMADPEMAETEPAAKPVEGQITMQSEDTILANDLIGTNVYSQSGDAIGEINDLIVNLEGSVDGVVIGVGGFLGLGEKDVAVEMASLSVSTGENGDMRLMTSATRADLEAAEAFMTNADQENARAMDATSGATNGTGIGGTADPAADPAASN